MSGHNTQSMNQTRSKSEEVMEQQNQSAPAEHVHSASSSDTGVTKQRLHRRKRLRLSCGECRSKKLSCNRELPCQRCIRSGRPERCSFEIGTTKPPITVGSSVVPTTHGVQHHAQDNSNQVQALQAEVSQLRALLSEARLRGKDAGESLPETATLRDTDESTTPFVPSGQQINSSVSAHLPERTSDVELWSRTPRNYYRQHSFFQFFFEVPELFSFIKETSNEWLKPRGISLSKGKPRTDVPRADLSLPVKSVLEGLLPAKADTDALVLFYLDHLEHIHRIVHIPTFTREYAHFWVPERARYPAMTALVLSMISISTCVSSSSSESKPVASANLAMPPKWISACDDWLRQQGSKARGLVFYQVSCLVYLAKRINGINKKTFWIETGSLIQKAVLDGLHLNAPLDPPYITEMKRRIWTVLRELELQTSFEYQLPTLLHSIDSDVAPPANLNDDEFDETSKELSAPKLADQYTCTSYQSLSARSWGLRLEISRCLFSTGIPKVLPYEDVLRFTHELTRAIDCLPSWTKEEAKKAKLQALASAFLRFQLQECILALHRSYIGRGDGRFWLSETTTYHQSRDILLLNSKLDALGIEGLTLLRADVLLASLSVTRMIMLQPKGSTSFAMIDSEAMIELLERCLPLTEERYLRCFYGEPWCPLTMYGAVMLLKIQAGQESTQSAKSVCAQRFIGLYHKHFRRQAIPLPQAQRPQVEESSGYVAGLPTPETVASLTSTWLDDAYPDFDFDSFAFGIDWDSAGAPL